MNETGTNTEYPRDASIHSLLEEVVERNADHTAVVFGDDRLSYRELNQRANRLAHHLRAHGVGPEVLVGICMDRSVDLYVALLAILKAGGAYVPLDPSYPEERLKMMVEDAGLGLIITKEGVFSDSTSDGPDIICMSRDAADLAQQSGENPATRIGAENLAYVMYTSGSTGKPKGVCVTHRAVCRLVRDTNYVEVLPSDRIAQAANSVFDAATFEIWGALLNGAQIVGVSRDDILSPKRLGRRLREEGVTTLFLTTALFNQVAREAPEAFGALKHLLFGGEAVDPHWVRVVLEQGAPERLLHVYGPTENTTFSTWHLVEEVAEDAKTIPIGKPVSNSTMIVLDQDFQPVATGAVGELCVGGDGLARGYLERSELTAERFVPNPFSAEDKDRLYRTGDLVRLLPDGSVEFSGRMDHQVKIRGFRVEPGEIEVALSEHSGVVNTVVVARSDMPGDSSEGLATGKELVAYVVAEPSGPADASGLRRFLKDRLPYYMVPSAFVLLPELPLNVNGKVDRSALPAPTAEDLYTSSVFVEPKTHTEKTLAGIWGEVLGLPRVGRDDDFMELGGHSLDAARVLSRVAGVFQVDVPVYSLFAKTRLSELAAEIENAQRKGEPTAVSSMKPVLRSRDLPLTSSQERVWFIQNMNPDNGAYHFQAALRFGGKLDVSALERSLSGIIDRHEAFRTTFHMGNNGPVQRICDPEPVVLDVVDLTGQGPEEQDETVGHAIMVEMQEPFDLEQLPLVRWRLFKLGEEEYSLGHVEHHLIHDGWSFNIFVRDLLELYVSHTLDVPAALPELPIQFADFAVWQREWLESDAAKEQRAFWERQLEGVPPMLDLPLDKPRPAVQGFNGGSFRWEIPVELCDAVRAFSKAEGSTMFVPLLEALTILLHRYSGQDDVSIGCGIANRRWRETEDMLGMIINNVVVRSDCSGQPTIHELMNRVRKTMLDAVAHQDLPFDSVVEAVQPERDLSFNPLFQVIFGLHDAPMPALEIPGLSLEVVPGMSNGSAKFDLTLIAIPTSAQVPGYRPNADGDGMTMLWEYNSELFERSTVERMAAHYQLILEAIVSDPTQVVDAIPLMAGAEVGEATDRWNDTGSPYPRSKRVHELFEEQAERSPGAVAIADGGAEITYLELNEEANRLAHYLDGQGVGRGTPVAFMLERSPDTIIAMLGILKAGGVYVPLDVSYPKTRLAHMLEDSGATVVLTRGDLLKEAGDAFSSATKITCLDAEGSDFEKKSKSNPDCAGGAEDLAYIMYTSGSTGKPKGVEIPHRAIVRLLFGVDYVRLGPSQTILQMAPVSFDAATFEIWGALLHGGTCALFPSRVPGTHELREAIRRYGVNTMWLTASLFNFMVDEDPEMLAPVEQLLIGGEALSVSHVRRAYEHLPATQIINGYGPTESTTFTCCYPIPRALAEGESSIPIGRPIANTTVYILDTHLQPLPPGVPGELVIGGDGLARGYRNDEGLTAERFVRDPFRDDPDSRLYKTGDLVRRLADGRIDFMGRLDDQVKLRGFRIELGEIERALSAHGGVRAASVMLRDDPLGHGPSVSGSEKYIAAYVIPALEDAPPSEEDLRVFLKEELPEYMVPSAFVFMEGFPLTANGKIDRRALPFPEAFGAVEAAGYVAPRTPTEEALAGIWAEVLKLDRVGIHDDFFGLGGHSLLATRVMSRVVRTLGIEFPLRNLFESPTVAELAEKIEAAGSEAAVPQAPMEVMSRAGPLPLSFAQQRLWFLDQLGSAGRAYHIHMSVRLHGDLDRVALGRALDRIVARHEALRTTFEPVDGEPTQRIADVEKGLHLHDHDLEEHPEAEAELHRLMALEAHGPFDLEQGPLFRGRLIRLSADDHVLLLTMHHIVSDGWSMGVLSHELSVLYGAFSRGDPDPLPALEVQYPDFAVWQRKWVDREALENQGNYWKETLEGVPELLDLPTDHVRPVAQDHTGGMVLVELDRELTAGLKALGQRHGATLFMTLLAGWATVLSRLSGQDDVVVGAPTAHRKRTEIEGLIGFFVNTLAHRMDLSGSPTVAELIGRAKAQALAAQQNQDIPFEQVVELLQPVRSLAHSPLFQVMFAWQNADPGRLELPGLTLGSIDRAEHLTAVFDLLLSLSEQDGRIVGCVEYAAALFERETVERYAGYFRMVLEGMVADDNQTVDGLQLLPEAERRQVVEGWNDTDSEYPSDSCIHELFEAQVHRTPDAVAVVSEEGRLTYEDLNSQANRLAHHLRDLGVGPDVPVAICLERSLELMVGLYAVLKAGGAYVPLDPSYPADRLRFMLEDSEPAALLTEESAIGLFGELRDDMPVIDLRADSAAWVHQPETNVDPGSVGLTPDHLAYIMYTSGSTGRPKGVMVGHRSVVNRIVWMQAAYPLDADDAKLQKTSVSFDVSVGEFFWPVMVGARLVLARPEGHKDPDYLIETIHRENITRVHFVPSMLQIFLEHPEVGTCSGLALVDCSGEALPVSLVERFHQRLPGVGLCNLYGPTESGEVTDWTCAPGEVGASIPIGRPIANTCIRILDEYGVPVPVGVVGEIFIGGIALARGYLNRPELTGERFVADGFGEEPGGRLYRTGDLGRWRSDGAIEFLGRNDFQVKVRGLRIELEEIEAQLMEYPAVRTAVVMARQDSAGSQRLVTYYVAEEGVDADVLRTHLSERLPESMVPAAYVKLDALPLTPSGKADRKALPAPEGDAYVTRTYEPPEGAVEGALVGIWSEVLEVERVGRWDNFFDLGGHSLLATQVMSRVRQILNVEVPLRTLFEAPTVTGLAERIEAVKYMADTKAGSDDEPMEEVEI